VTKKDVTNRQKEDMKFAWKLIKYVKSNSIIIAKD
jgi:AICAR transformylase/IMP cyclohydrolase PurH